MTRANHPQRSYVRREGRLTAAQARALDVLMPVFGIECGEEMLDFQSLFGRTAPVILEIGFGNGVSLADSAMRHPDWDFIGIEVHRPGVGRLLNTLEHNHIRNVRIMCSDAAQVLQHNVPPAALTQIWIFFPDPWPKKRHHKRRLIQPEFAAHLANRLADHGVLLCATDWQDYAEHMLDILDATPGLVNQHGKGSYAPRADERPLTKFEQRGLSRGHTVHDLRYMKGITPRVLPSCNGPQHD